MPEDDGQQQAGPEGGTGAGVALHRPVARRAVARPSAASAAPSAYSQVCGEIIADFMGKDKDIPDTQPIIKSLFHHEVEKASQRAEQEEPRGGGGCGGNDEDDGGRVCVFLGGDRGRKRGQQD